MLHKRNISVKIVLDNSRKVINMSDNDIGKKIKDLRLAKGMTLEQVAQKVGVEKSTVRKWETGMIVNMRRDKIASLAKALDISPAYLMGWENEDNLPPYPNIYPIKTKKFPLLGQIACGEPIFASEDHESYIEAGADIKADFCLKAKGDSMINARIMDGDIVFIRKQPTVNNGQIAAVIIEDEATLKRVYYYPEKAKLLLQAENPAYEPLMYVGEELNQIRIIGLAVAFQSDVR